MRLTESRHIVLWGSYPLKASADVSQAHHGKQAAIMALAQMGAFLFAWKKKTVLGVLPVAQMTIGQ